MADDWHVIWTTCNGYLPGDRRGDWSSLRSLYEGIAADQLSEPLHERYLAAPRPAEAVILPRAAWEPLRKDLAELVASDDRLEGVELLACSVESHGVELLISCSPDSLQRAVGRLKSRSATLLGFRPELGLGAGRVWGKGFWRARLLLEEERAAALRRVQGAL